MLSVLSKVQHLEFTSPGSSPKFDLDCGLDSLGKCWIMLDTTLELIKSPSLNKSFRHW